MHNVRLGLVWAAAIILVALLGNALGLDKQLSFSLITGLSVIAVLHIGRSEARRKSADK